MQNGDCLLYIVRAASIHIDGSRLRAKIILATTHWLHQLTLTSLGEGGTAIEDHLRWNRSRLVFPPANHQLSATITSNKVIWKRERRANSQSSAVSCPWRSRRDNHLCILVMSNEVFLSIFIVIYDIAVLCHPQMVRIPHTLAGNTREHVCLPLLVEALFG